MVGRDAAGGPVFTQRRAPALLDAAAFETGTGILQIAATINHLRLTNNLQTVDSFAPSTT